MEGNSFRSVYPDFKGDFLIQPETKVMSIGSCFSEHISTKLMSNGLQIIQNPFGILYNPISIATNLNRALNFTSYQMKDLAYHDGLWHCFDFHGRFSHPDQKICLDKVNQAISTASRAIKSSDVVLLTFGTGWGFRMKESGKIVANCHKFPALEFERVLLKPGKIIDIWKGLFKNWFAVNPDIKLLISISPVRYLRDGMHGNNLGKASLQLAVDELVNQFDMISYFPAFELITDDLRDYRFFDHDYAHPSREAIGYVWKRFKKAYLSAELQNIIKSIEKIKKQSAHISLHEHQSMQKARQSKIKNSLERLIEEYPVLDKQILYQIIE